ncbi:MAG TPA: hypothetical protein ENN87_16430 [Phycisphaerales bacterium]|nr:hypothetical protein [Phycisphaerales bacterium]
MKRTLFAAAVLGGLAVAGCQRFQMDAEVFDRFELATLKVSRSADVLNAIKEDDEMLVQSPTVVALWGQRDEQNRLWCNAVAFDEESLTAVRKYATGYEQFDRSYFITARRKLRFDAELVAPRQLLDEPYANTSDRNRAILAWAMESFREDMDTLGGENTDLLNLVMLVRQTGNGILQTLDRSPGLAANLADPEGVAFDQINLGPGRVRMLIQDDVARIKIKVGKEWFDLQPFEKHSDVQNM